MLTLSRTYSRLFQRGFLSGLRNLCRTRFLHLTTLKGYWYPRDVNRTGQCLNCLENCIASKKERTLHPSWVIREQEVEADKERKNVD